MQGAGTEKWLGPFAREPDWRLKLRLIISSSLEQYNRQMLVDHDGICVNHYGPSGFKM